jgi:alpha-L-arabinofuranosidase
MKRAIFQPSASCFFLAKAICFGCLFWIFGTHAYGYSSNTSEPDSAYFFAYAKEKSAGREGLLYAWSLDGKKWNPIGTDLAFVKSDYGRWGSEKRMINPILFPRDGGGWACAWQLSPEINGAYAQTFTTDFFNWGRQDYYVKLNDLDKSIVSFVKNSLLNRENISINGESLLGTKLKVSWPVIKELIKHYDLALLKQKQWSERSVDDEARFPELKPLDVKLTPNIGQSKSISDMLVGVFFEDINYAADGGLYAEMIQNRDFEYKLSDKQGHDNNWNQKTAWSIVGPGQFQIDSIHPIHPNNKYYARLKGEGILRNIGYDGIPLNKGEGYDLSFFGRNAMGKGRRLKIRISTKDGKILDEKSLTIDSKNWKKYQLVLKSNENCKDAVLEFAFTDLQQLDLDLISLFPQHTFKGRKNGLRKDLAEAIVALNPRFVRFPGGCLAHGDGIENIYHWSNTVGPLESRVPQRNMWGYHQTVGLGYYEYFQFCEDIGAYAVPVVAAGVPCQNSGAHGHPLGGQQCGIPMEDMDDYIQEVLNLIEWANGDKNSTWGKVRAAAGHPEPFHLKYIGVGNEDLISNVFEERFTMIYNAIRAKYPEIQVIGTAGPFFEGTDYVEGWKIANKLNVPIMDEHYYQTPGWFIHNQDFYDKYDRSKSQVYLGEYAAHIQGRASTLEVALAEAAYLTALERNGDVVKMASYAPLLAKDGYTQWRPDLIYFSNTDVNLTPSYYVQQLFGRNNGTEYIPVEAVYSNAAVEVQKRVAFSIVKDPKDQSLIVKLVNILPVAINIELELDQLNLKADTALVSQLTGKLESKTAKPEEKTMAVEKLKKQQLPPYSLTIIRIQSGAK